VTPEILPNQTVKDIETPCDVSATTNRIALSESNLNGVIRNEDFDQIEVDASFKTNNIVNCNIKNLEIATRSDKDSYHTAFQQKLMQDKVEAERLSSMRSLKTNLILIMFFFTANLFLLIPCKSWQLFFGVINTSFQKTVLPIATTLANFGTIRTVCSQYWRLAFNT
jgi:hypothetical protein